MSHVIRFGIDLAKDAFAICGVNDHDHIVTRKTLPRSKVLTFFANTPIAMVATEAGSGAHHWRQLIAQGHDARIIYPALVAPWWPPIDRTARAYRQERRQ